jgi:hypothetical protein
MYYLLNEPATYSPPFTLSNVKFASVSPASTIPGSVTVQVGALTNHCCSVVAVGSSAPCSGGGVLTRTITAEVQVGKPLPINQAAGFYSGVTIGSNVTLTSSGGSVPAVSSTGTVTDNGTVSGVISAVAVNGSQSGSVTLVAAPSSAPAPSSSANVNYLANGTQYVYQGVVKNAQVISSPISSATSLQPDPINNPLGIFYVNSNLTVNNTLNVTGTLIVTGNVTNSSTIAITPVTSSSLSTSMPAMVVGGKFTTSGSHRSLSATGVVYVAQGIYGSGSTATSSIAVNGALMITSGGISNTFAGPVSVNFNSSYTNIPSFDTADWDSGSGVKIISWSE